MKQILKYPGSKYKSADWIIRQFPEHHSYLEPFFGSGAILFNKERSDIETINDLDGEVINLFRQIKEFVDVATLLGYAISEFIDGAVAQGTQRAHVERFMVGITQRAIATSRAEAYRKAVQEGEKR